MPWCPGCGAEYLEGIKVCPECSRELKDAPPLAETFDFDPEDWEVVFTANGPEEAQMIHSLLESNGIATAGRDSLGALRNLYPGVSTPAGNINIYVMKDKLAEAMEIIRANTLWSQDELVNFMEKHGELDYEDTEDIDKD